MAGGSIILNASIGASKGFGGFGVYNATKAAVRSFARTWTVDLKQRRIRVNAISPGPIDTPIFDGLLETDEQIEQFKAGLVSSVPLGRMGSPDEIAKAVHIPRLRRQQLSSPALSCSSMGVWRKYR